MASSGRDEGLLMLEEFHCEAISEAHPSPLARLGRGVNPGIRIVTETVLWADTPAVTTERIDELRRMSINPLLAFVKLRGQELDGEVLLAIHDLAAERLGESDPPFSEAAVELCREAMLAAVNRSG